MQMKFNILPILAVYAFASSSSQDSNSVGKPDTPSKALNKDDTAKVLESINTETAIVFPAIGSAYVRGTLEKNKMVTVVYSPLRMGFVKCRYVTVCWKYDGLIQTRKCSHEISREAAFAFEFKITRAGKITFDFQANDYGTVCASEENLVFKIKRKGIFQ